MISCRELGSALKLKRPDRLREIALKYFNSDEVEWVEEIRRININNNLCVIKKDILLTNVQARLLISRSRGDTQSALNQFNLGETTIMPAFRNEMFFMGLVESILAVTDFKLLRQYKCSNYQLDGVIIGSNKVILVIEYNERNHKYSDEADKNRKQNIISEFLKNYNDVLFLTIDDNNQSVINGIKDISNIIHSDVLGPVTYSDLFNNYLDD